MDHSLGIYIESCGWDYHHPIGFTIDRPQGRSDWGVVLFTTRGRWVGSAGVRHLPAGSCLIFPPGYPQEYGSDGAPFANHWCHWTGPYAQPLAAALDIPLTGPITLSDPSTVARGLHDVVREFLRREHGWEAACGLALATALVAMARGSRSAGRSGNDARLRDVRAALHAQPAQRWPVARMARMAGLSPSRFTARYRAAFAISPLADLIHARVARARLLIESGSGVAAAAQDSGFFDLPYFYRQFRSIVGCTPARCRQR